MVEGRDCAREGRKKGRWEGVGRAGRMDGRAEEWEVRKTAMKNLLPR